MNERKFVQHIRSDKSDSYGNPILPSPDKILDGEIAINYAKDKERIAFKNNQNEIVTISTDKTNENKFSQKVLFIDGSNGDVNQTIKPNTFYNFGVCTNLTLSFEDEINGILNEYMFQFTSGETATVLNLPKDIKWLNGTVPTIEPLKVYQVSIVNKFGLICGW